MDKATKKEFGKVKKEFVEVHKRLDQCVTKTKFDLAMKQMVTRFEFEDFVQYVHENMVTKRDFMMLIDKMDDVLTEFKHTRANNVLIGPQLCDLDDTVAKHGKRITVLEEKVLR